MNNIAEVFRALLDGKKVARSDWGAIEYIYMKDGFIYDEKNEGISAWVMNADNIQDFEIYDERLKYNLENPLDRYKALEAGYRLIYTDTYNHQHIMYEAIAKADVFRRDLINTDLKFEFYEEAKFSNSYDLANPMDRFKFLLRGGQLSYRDERGDECYIHLGSLRSDQFKAYLSVLLGPNFKFEVFKEPNNE